MPYVEFEGEVRPLGPGVLTIGSAPEAGWRIQGRGLDPVHALLSVQTGGRALLIRRAPAAAVLVNNVELVAPRTLLSFGDCLRMGTAEMRYRRLAPGDLAPAAYLRDTRRGRLYQLRERSTIGRDFGSTVAVHDPDVSRLHAELIQRGEAYLIVPHGASVTSVNGARLIAPTTLQEGDEIAIGRTVLRFTTALPTGSAVSAESIAPAGNAARMSRAQTTFMGAIEARDQKARVTRRRMHRLAAIGVVAIAMAAIVVTLYADAHALTGRDPRHAGRSGRRQAREPAAGSGVEADDTPGEAAGPLETAATPRTAARPGPGTKAGARTASASRSAPPPPARPQP